MQKKDVDREARLRELALKLFFTLEKQGSQFALFRDVMYQSLFGTTTSLWMR
jgi:hypothetical protein